MSSPQKEVAFAASPPHSAERLRLSGQSILSVYLGHHGKPEAYRTVLRLSRVPLNDSKT